MIGWAAVSACTATVKSYSGLIACRFFLGFVEAVSSCQLPIMATYTKPLNTAILPGRLVFAIDLLHSERTRYTYFASLYRPSRQHWLFRAYRGSYVLYIRPSEGNCWLAVVSEQPLISHNT